MSIEGIVNDFQNVEQSLAEDMGTIGALSRKIDSVARANNPDLWACEGGAIHEALGLAAMHAGYAQKFVMQAHCEAKDRATKAGIVLPQPESGGR